MFAARINLLELLALLIVLTFTWVWMVIFHKAGWSSWWGLLMLVPIVNLATAAFLMFREWPIQREVRELRQRLTQYGGA